MSSTTKPETRQVWKFPLPTAREFALNMPIDARLLAVGAQGDTPCLWALCAVSGDSEQRRFSLRGTGADVQAGLEYVGTFALGDGAFMGHVFEVLG